MNEVVAVIVTCNRKELLQKCIEMIQAQQDAAADILVFDNSVSLGADESGRSRRILPGHGDGCLTGV